MKRVGVYDLKTHLGRLIDEVEQGETITITRHGKAVARIKPIERVPRPMSDVIAEMREFRRRHPLDGLSIRDLIDEGRRT